MGKPPGIALGLSGDGVHMGVTRSSEAEDKVWEAVEQALIENWTPDRFIREVREAWAQARKDLAEADDGEFKRMLGGT